MTFLQKTFSLSLTFSGFFIFSTVISPINAREFPPVSVNVVSAEITTLTPVIWVSGTIVSQNERSESCNFGKTQTVFLTKTFKNKGFTKF